MASHEGPAEEAGSSPAPLRRTGVAILTEPRLHPGLAALLNSLARAGFDGTAWVGHRGDPPAWAAELGRVLPGFDVRFVALETPRPFTYYKPVFVRRVLDELDPEADAVFYFDTDIVVARPWSFFTAWARYGICLVEDLPHRQMASDHPVRRAWREWLDELGLAVRRPDERYFNAGFVGVPRRAAAFLDPWEHLVELSERLVDVRRPGLHYTAGAGEGLAPLTVAPHIRDVLQPTFQDDQDALNMALMVTDEPVSPLGAEGMGFTDAWNVAMAHAVGPDKPWSTRYCRRLVRGGPGPTKIDVLWWRLGASGPLPVLGPSRARLARLDLGVARALDRVL